jgi:hypothetical protein
LLIEKHKQIIKEMRQRLLPIGIFSFLIFGLAAFIYSYAAFNSNDRAEGLVTKQKTEAPGAYMALLRNNQHTGVLDPKDVIAARAQMQNHASYKSGKTSPFDWDELGPDNMGGRTRALLFDNQDATGNTVYAGAVTGGLFKSTNGGSNWSKTNTGGNLSPLPVTTMVQDDNGTIYVGTGEGFGTEAYTATGQFGYTGGFIGKGMFKSGSGDNFTLIPSTTPTPQGDIVEWGYINKLAIDKKNNRLFAATNTGLKVSALNDLSSWQSEFKYRIDSTIVNRTITIDSVITCDSFKIINGNFVTYGSTGWQINISQNDTTDQQVVHTAYIPFSSYGISYDVKVSPEGWVITTFNNKIYVSYNGDVNQFVNRSIYPNNPDNIRKDNINWTANITIKDKTGAILLDSTTNFNTVADWHTDYKFDSGSAFIEYPNSANGGRTEFAISPSHPNIVYAMVAKGNFPNIHSLVGVYLSEDAGQSWRIIAPGGAASLNILGSAYGASNTRFFQGNYTNVLTVFPNDPYRIIAGGYDLWYGFKVNESGYFSWDKRSISDASILFDGIFDELYCHRDHHIYVFRPGNSNQFIIGTDGGLYLGKVSGNFITYQSYNKNYNTAQFYSLAISGQPNEYIGGAQDNGTLYNRGKGGTGKSAQGIWRPANFPPQYIEGTDGGTVAYSTIRSITLAGEEVPPPVFYSKSPYPNGSEALNVRMRRSESLGFDYSLQFLPTTITDNRYLTPMVLWESYDNQLSSRMTTWVANMDYEAGTPVVVRSNTLNHPFDHFLEESVSQGDTIMVKDIITNKLFIGTENKVFMTLESMDFSKEPEWYTISDRAFNGVDGRVQCLAYSSDANYVWAGTMSGKLFRISNIAYATGADDANVSSPNCIIATTEVPFGDNNTQIITSVSVDPGNPNNVLVTLGNYGNDIYVYYSTNGLADFPVFNAIQGDLPKVPVYSSLIEMDSDSDLIMVGTEMGLWASDNAASGIWYSASPEIGEVPVMAIKQQTLYKGTFTLTFYDPGTNEPFYETFPGIENYKDIYIATHGRGVFRIDNESIGIDELRKETSKQGLQFGISPNPASGNITLRFSIAEKAIVNVNVYDLSGRMVYSENFGEVERGENRLALRLSGLKDGTYLLQMVAGSQIASQKLVVIQ